MLQKTLNWERFLVRDLTVEKDRILILTTEYNIEKLANGLFWIMDGTFKTVSTIFYQLHIIQTSFEINNSITYPLV